MNIKQLNEGFKKLYEEACEEFEDELTFDDIDFDPSIEGEEVDSSDEPLDEALPKDLITQLRNTDNMRRGRNFNIGPGGITNEWDPDTKDWTRPASGVADIQNATYTEITPQEVMKMKKDGKPLEGIYIMKNGRMIALDNYGSPLQGMTTMDVRANQSLKKSLEGADKIYLANIPDALDSQPDKMKARLSNTDDRYANQRLGKFRDDSFWTTSRKNTRFSKEATDLNKEIAHFKDLYDRGIISRNEMNDRIAAAKKYFREYSSWQSDDYQRARNRNAEARYTSSKAALQKPFDDLKQYRSEIRSANYALDKAKDALAAAETGDTGGRWISGDKTYANAVENVNRLTKEIERLKAELDRYQEIVNSDAQQKDIKAAKDRIDYQTSIINDTQDKIDKLLRRKP